MHLESGDILAAEALIKEAFENLKLTNQRWYEPNVYRIAANVMLKKPDSDPVMAEAYLRRAIEVAKTQQAKW